MTMATTTMIPNLALLATCVAAIWSCNNALMATAASSPQPSVADCTAVVYEMLPCVTYITIGSTKTKPSNDCCQAVDDVLKSNHGECMCDALKQSGTMGIQLNLTRALTLSTACGVSTPLPDCGIPLPPGLAPAPVIPSGKAPVPAPASNSAAPTPVPNAAAPGPAPRTLAPGPAPAPRTLAPGPARRILAPAPVPSTMAPTPGPNGGPMAAPVNPPAPAAPAQAPGMAPGSSSTSPPAPSNDSDGPSSDDSPAPAPSAAPSFTISSNIILPLLFTILASFRPL